MKYRNGREAVLGDSVVCLVVGTGGGMVGAINGDVLRLLTYESRRTGERYDIEPVTVGKDAHFEPVIRSAVALDCLHVEDVGVKSGDVTDIEDRIKAAVPGIAPSGDHDLLEEVLGLLRVTQGQRDDNGKLHVETLAKLDLAQQEIAGLKAALTAEAKPVEDKATLSLFPGTSTDMTPPANT